MIPNTAKPSKQSSRCVLHWPSYDALQELPVLHPRNWRNANVKLCKILSGSLQDASHPTRRCDSIGGTRSHHHTAAETFQSAHQPRTSTHCSIAKTGRNFHTVTEVDAPEPRVDKPDSNSAAQRVQEPSTSHEDATAPRVL